MPESSNAPENKPVLFFLCIFLGVGIIPFTTVPVKKREEWLSEYLDSWEKGLTISCTNCPFCHNTKFIIFIVNSSIFKDLHHQLQTVFVTKTLKKLFKLCAVKHTRETTFCRQQVEIT